MPNVEWSERKRLDAMWLQTRFAEVSWILACHGIADETALRDLGYEEVMRLSCSYDPKAAICRGMGWPIPSTDHIADAWRAIGMTTRTANTLALEGIIDGEGVRRRSDSEFMRIPNFGRKSLNELHNWLNPSSETSTLAIARPPLATFSDEELLAELRHRLSRR